MNVAGVQPSSQAVPGWFSPSTALATPPYEPVLAGQGSASGLHTSECPALGAGRVGKVGACLAHWQARRPARATGIRQRTARPRALANARANTELIGRTACRARGDAPRQQGSGSRSRRQDVSEEKHAQRTHRLPPDHNECTWSESTAGRRVWPRRRALPEARCYDPNGVEPSSLVTSSC
jgi:hypothetical protein